MDNMDAIGIYQIRNLLNGMLYIGSTTRSFHIRWAQHLNALQLGKHHSRHMQNSWNKHGPAAFAFEIIEEIDDVELVIPREQFWLDQYAPTGLLYNSSPTAGSTRGYQFTEEGKANIGKGVGAFYRTPKGRAMASQHAKQLYATEEGRARHAEGQKRRWENPAHRAKSSESQRLRGQDPELRRRLSEAQLRRLEDPETREQLNERNRRIARDPEVKAKKNATLRETLARPEVKTRMGEAQQRRFSTDEAKAAASRAVRPRDEHGEPVRFHLRGPDGTIYWDIPNVSGFCRERGLSVWNIQAVLRGEVRRSAGWTRYDGPAPEGEEE